MKPVTCVLAATEQPLIGEFNERCHAFFSAASWSNVAMKGGYS